VASGPHEQRGRDWRALLRRKVHVFAGFVREGRPADVAHHADDFRRVLLPELDAASHRWFVREESIRDGLADHDDGRPARDVAIAEQPSGAKRDPQGVEVPGRRRLPANIGRALPRG
jgi:hypothetical protein